MKKKSKEIELDSRVKPVVFDVMCDMLEKGKITEVDIKKTTYKSEYQKIKAKKVK